MFSSMALSGYHGLFNNAAFPITTSPMVQLVCVHALCLWEFPSTDASTMVPLPTSFVLDPLAAEAQTYPHHAPPSPAASAMYLQTNVTLKTGRSQLLPDLPCKRGATIKPSRVEVRLSEEVVGSYGVQNGEIGIPEGHFHERGRITTMQELLTKCPSSLPPQTALERPVHQQSKYSIPPSRTARCVSASRMASTESCEFCTALVDEHQRLRMSHPWIYSRLLPK